ncbi:AMP-binding protein, partial [Lactobacillus panisapium]
MIKNIIKKIDQIALAEPDRIAYDFLGQTNTYGDLKKRSDAWAGYIMGLNLSPGSPIMIWGGQTFDMIASFLGCVKAGHAYIPIASYSNAERIVLIQEVAAAEAIIAIEELPAIALPDLQVIRPEEVG